MGRWSKKEYESLAKIRFRLKDKLTDRPQFPEVVGDRRLLRFIRGKNFDIDHATKMISNFLDWRLKNNVDEIRQDIVYGGKNSPLKFPKGEIILKLAPQIIISANSTDYKGQPLALEQYCFNPRDVFKEITIQEYLLFLTYALEYRAIVMEQMSDEKEIEYLKANPNPENRKDGYGIILLDFTIRDLKGVGFSHLGSDGRALVHAALSLGLPNYEEYLGKCHMVNVPWIFNSMWYFVKGLLDEETIAKISLCGSDYLDVLLKDMPIENIPACLGGKFESYNEPFDFDLSENGPLWTPTFPIDIDYDEKRFSRIIQNFINNQSECLDREVRSIGLGANSYMLGSLINTKAEPYPIADVEPIIDFEDYDDLTHESKNNEENLSANSSLPNFQAHPKSLIRQLRDPFFVHLFILILMCLLVWAAYKAPHVRYILYPVIFFLSILPIFNL